jgi:hypothetical protein
MLTKSITVAVALAGLRVGSVGTMWISKAIKPEIKLSCPPAPPCNCPAAVELQSFDLSKLNNKKGNFTYSPQLHDVRIVIESKDSVLVKQILKSSR